MPSQSPALYAYGFVAGLRDSFVGLLQLRTLNARIEEYRDRVREKRAARSYIAAKATKDKLSLIATIKRIWLWNFMTLGASVLAFNLIVLPILTLISSWLETAIVLVQLATWIFNAAWVLPVMVTLEVVNYFSFKDVGQLVYIVAKKDRRAAEAAPFGARLADQIFWLAVELLFMLQAKLVRHLPLPVLSDVLYYCHICMLYSLYAFDYRWANRDAPFHSRVSCLENNWPYFLAFGLPMTLATWLPPWYGLSICCLSFVFPVYIVSALCAQRHQQYRAPIRLPLLKPSLYIVNRLLLAVQSGRRRA